MNPSLLFMILLSGSVKFICALGSGSVEGGAAGFPGFLRPSLARSLLGFRRRLGLRFRCRLGLGLERCLGLSDFLSAPLLVADPIGHLVAVLVFAVQPILLGIRRLGSCEP